MARKREKRSQEPRKQPPPRSTRRGKQSDPKPTPPVPPQQRLHEDEPSMFLRFATALKILLGRSIDDRAIARGLQLLQEYLLQFREMYGEKAMRPNHHWVVHQPDQIRDYGPVYGFWLFLIECLNKTLKNYNTNHHGAGQMEITLVRSFGREKRVQSLVSAAAGVQSSSDAEKIIARKMLSKSGEDCGTVESQAAASHLEGQMRLDALDDAVESRVHITVGTPISKLSQSLSTLALKYLHGYYNSGGQARVYYSTSRHIPPGARLLSPSAIFYKYALLDGRRVVPLTRTQRRTAGSSIVRVLLDGRALGGEVLSLFCHSQPGINNDTLWAEMRWMKRVYAVPTREDLWVQFPELQIECWELGKYYSHEEHDAPPPFIPFSAVQCQISRGQCLSSEPAVWMTTTMDRDATSLAISDTAVGQNHPVDNV